MALVVYSPLWRHAETLTVRPWWCTALCGHTLHIVNHLFVLLLFRRLQLLLLLQFHCTGTSHSEVPDLPCWKTATLPTPPSSPQMAKFLRRASRRALVKQRWLLNFHRRSVLLRHTQRARHHPPLCLHELNCAVRCRCRSKLPTGAAGPCHKLRPPGPCIVLAAPGRPWVSPGIWQAHTESHQREKCHQMQHNNGAQTQHDKWRATMAHDAIHATKCNTTNGA